MEVGKKFSNIASYNNNMAKGLIDKLFFFNKLNIKPDTPCVYVDFGCADGTLINAMYEKNSNTNRKYIGYDISDTMIDFAKSKFAYNTRNVEFTTSWEEVEEILKVCHRYKKILILSSVIHEVYSYSDIKGVDDFWNRVTNSGFDYICVRDMMLPEEMYSTFAKTPQKLVNLMKAYINSEYIESYQSHWGNIENYLHFLHLLLKYRWKINWERELNENYFPIAINELIYKFNENYNLFYLQRFNVPFLEKCWKEELDIELDDNIFTHIKAIFTLKHKN